MKRTRTQSGGEVFPEASVASVVVVLGGVTLRVFGIVRAQKKKRSRKCRDVVVCCCVLIVRREKKKESNYPG